MSQPYEDDPAWHMVKRELKNRGKEVVQVYVSSPTGKLDQPYQTLVAFAKTAELEPGENTWVETAFSLSEAAGYNEEKEVFVLEKDDYILRVGNSSRNTSTAAIITLANDVITNKVRNCLGKPEYIEEISPDPGNLRGYSGLPADLPRAELPVNF